MEFVFDECGWAGNNGESFQVAAGAAPYLEHMMLTEKQWWMGLN
jgi:hypothetical protein